MSLLIIFQQGYGGRLLSLLRVPMLIITTYYYYNIMLTSSPILVVSCSYDYNNTLILPK